MRVERIEVVDGLGKEAVNGSCIIGGVDAAEEEEEDEDMGLLVVVGAPRGFLYVLEVDMMVGSEPDNCVLLSVAVMRLLPVDDDCC